MVVHKYKYTPYEEFDYNKFFKDCLEYNDTEPLNDEKSLNNFLLKSDRNVQNAAHILNPDTGWCAHLQRQTEKNYLRKELKRQWCIKHLRFDLIR